MSIRIEMELKRFVAMQYPPGGGFVRTDVKKSFLGRRNDKIL
jgi:hypothetical protein